MNERLKLQLSNLEPREGGQKRVKPWAELPQAILKQGTPEREKNQELYRSQLMAQSTPCPQQTGTFTSVLASAQALGEAGGDSNEQLLLLLLPCLALSTQGLKVQKPST